MKKALMVLTVFSCLLPLAAFAPEEPVVEIPVVVAPSLSSVLSQTAPAGMGE